MSEYWKSTPKYWCKHCKTFVRDTKLEKANHEATAKHQGNIKRFLRDLHRGHEREEREKDRAKSEVERLNGVVSAGLPSTKAAGPQSHYSSSTSVSAHKEPTPAERKAQLARLAELGVAVPEDYRREVAMAGDWQTIAERPIRDQVKKEEGSDDFKNFNPDHSLNVGVRKRKFDGQEEEEEAGATVVRKGWGSTTRRYPDVGHDGDGDLETLLSAKRVTEAEEPRNRDQQPMRPASEKLDGPQNLRLAEAQAPSIKREDTKEGGDLSNVPSQDLILDTAIKQEDDTQPAITFKKRKAKSSAAP